MGVGRRARSARTRNNPSDSENVSKDSPSKNHMGNNNSTGKKPGILTEHNSSMDSPNKKRESSGSDVDSLGSPAKKSRVDEGKEVEINDQDVDLEKLGNVDCSPTKKPAEQKSVKGKKLETALQDSKLKAAPASKKLTATRKSARGKEMEDKRQDEVTAELEEAAVVPKKKAAVRKSARGKQLEEKGSEEPSTSEEAPMSKEEAAVGRPVKGKVSGEVVAHAEDPRPDVDALKKVAAVRKSARRPPSDEKVAGEQPQEDQVVKNEPAIPPVCRGTRSSSRILKTTQSEKSVMESPISSQKRDKIAVREANEEPEPSVTAPKQRRKFVLNKQEAEENSEPDATQTGRVARVTNKKTGAKECVGSNDESYLVKPAEESKHSSSQPEPTRTRSKRLAQKAMTDPTRQRKSTKDHSETDPTPKEKNPKLAKAVQLVKTPAKHTPAKEREKSVQPDKTPKSVTKSVAKKLDKESEIEEILSQLDSDSEAEEMKRKAETPGRQSSRIAARSAQQSAIKEQPTKGRALTQTKLTDYPSRKSSVRSPIKKKTIQSVEAGGPDETGEEKRVPVWRKVEPKPEPVSSRPDDIYELEFSESEAKPAKKKRKRAPRKPKKEEYKPTKPVAALPSQPPKKSPSPTRRNPSEEKLATPPPHPKRAPAETKEDNTAAIPKPNNPVAAPPSQPAIMSPSPARPNPSEEEQSTLPPHLEGASAETKGDNAAVVPKPSKPVAALPSEQPKSTLSPTRRNPSAEKLATPPPHPKRTLAKAEEDNAAAVSKPSKPVAALPSQPANESPSPARSHPSEEKLTTLPPPLPRALAKAKEDNPGAVPKLGGITPLLTSVATKLTRFPPARKLVKENEEQQSSNAEELASPIHPLPPLTPPPAQPESEPSMFMAGEGLPESPSSYHSDQNGHQAPLLPPMTITSNSSSSAPPAQLELDNCFGFDDDDQDLPQVESTPLKGKAPTGIFISPILKNPHVRPTFDDMSTSRLIYESPPPKSSTSKPARLDAREVRKVIRLVPAVPPSLPVQAAKEKKQTTLMDFIRETNKLDEEIDETKKKNVEISSSPPSTFTAPPRRSYSRKSMEMASRAMFQDAEEGSDEEGEVESDKKTKKKKKNPKKTSPHTIKSQKKDVGKAQSKREAEAEEWAKLISSHFEEVEKFNLSQ